MNFICTPLFEAFDKKFFSESMRKTVSDQIKANIEYWTGEIDKEVFYYHCFLHIQERGESNYLKETGKIMDEIKQEMAG